MPVPIAAWAAALAVQSAAGPPLPIVYDFEDGTTGRIRGPAAAGWSFTVVDSDAHGGRRSVLMAAEGLPTTPGIAAAAVPATPYVGHALRLSAWVRIEGPATPIAGLWLAIYDADGRQIFLDNMHQRPVRPGDWTEVDAIVIVPEDAARIVFGPIKTGPGSLFLDDLVLEVPELRQEASSVEARSFVAEALNLLRTWHIHRDQVDWARIEDAALRLLSGAQMPADTHRIIRTIIDRLGEPHTLLRPATTSRSASVVTPAQPASGMSSDDGPIGSMTSARVGRLTLPALITQGTEPEFAERYRRRLVEHVEDLRARGACGWIVDLRNNGGGNMWPMINGLEALLGGGPFGAFGQTSGPDNYWVRTQSAIRADAAGQPPFTGSPGALAGDPVAVLLGPRTASSGEMTAIAFRGRPNTRFFGTSTAGLTTANAPFPLSDGSWLLITTSRVHDGAGNLIEGPLVPDETTDPEDALGVAVAWLRRQGCTTEVP